jgi:hypothetical protein
MDMAAAKDIVSIVGCIVNVAQWLFVGEKKNERRGR